MLGCKLVPKIHVYALKCSVYFCSRWYDVVHMHCKFLILLYLNIISVH